MASVSAHPTKLPLNFQRPKICNPHCAAEPITRLDRSPLQSPLPAVVVILGFGIVPASDDSHQTASVNNAPPTANRKTASTASVILPHRDSSLRGTSRSVPFRDRLPAATNTISIVTTDAAAVPIGVVPTVSKKRKKDFMIFNL